MTTKKTIYKIQLEHGYFGGYDLAGDPIITNKVKEIRRWHNRALVGVQMSYLRRQGHKPKLNKVTVDV